MLVHARSRERGHGLLEADLASAPYWKGRRPTSVPRHLRDEGLQDAIAAACDRLAGIAA